MPSREIINRSSFDNFKARNCGFGQSKWFNKEGKLNVEKKIWKLVTPILALFSFHWYKCKYLLFWRRKAFELISMNIEIYIFVSSRLEAMNNFLPSIWGMTGMTVLPVIRSTDSRLTRSNLYFLISTNQK